MFTPNHEIWKFAQYWDELDDWLPYAEWLIEKWSNQSVDEIELSTTFEIIIASYLLMDDLLPASAKKAMAYLVLETISQVTEKKIAVKCLHIQTPGQGRKENKAFKFMMIHRVRTLLESGASKTEAYNTVATELSRSPDTIRRAYERHIKMKPKHGDIKQIISPVTEE